VGIKIASSCHKQTSIGSTTHGQLFWACVASIDELLGSCRKVIKYVSLMVELASMHPLSPILHTTGQRDISSNAPVGKPWVFAQWMMRVQADTETPVAI